MYEILSRAPPKYLLIFDTTVTAVYIFVTDQQESTPAAPSHLLERSSWYQEQEGFAPQRPTTDVRGDSGKDAGGHTSFKSSEEEKKKTRSGGNLGDLSGFVNRQLL